MSVVELPWNPFGCSFKGHLQPINPLGLSGQSHGPAVLFGSRLTLIPIAGRDSVIGSFALIRTVLWVGKPCTLSSIVIEIACRKEKKEEEKKVPRAAETGSRSAAPCGQRLTKSGKRKAGRGKKNWKGQNGGKSGNGNKTHLHQMN
jgi:hypothetical protein